MSDFHRMLLAGAAVAVVASAYAAGGIVAALLDWLRCLGAGALHDKREPAGPWRPESEPEGRGPHR